MGGWLPDNLEDAIKVRLDLFDSLRQQPTIRSDAHVGHPVDRDQGLHQPAQRVERGVARLEEEGKNYVGISLLPAKIILLPRMY